MVDALYLRSKETPVRYLVTSHTVARTCSQANILHLQAFRYPWFGLAFYLPFSAWLISLSSMTVETACTSLAAAIGLLSFRLALIISAFLVGIQAFVLQAFCEYCLLSAALVLSIFLLSPHPAPHTPPNYRLRLRHSLFAAFESLTFSRPDFLNHPLFSFFERAARNAVRFEVGLSYMPIGSRLPQYSKVEEGKISRASLSS